MVRLSHLKTALPTKVFDLHLKSKKRLPVHAALLYCPDVDIRAMMRRAAASGALGRNCLQRTFLAARSQGRFERAVSISRVWSEEMQKKLSPVHLNTLMSFAVHQNEWKMALQWWGDLTSNPEVVLDPRHYATLLAALKHGGRWTQALAVMEEVRSERVPVTPHIGHALLSCMRHHAPWQVALQTASHLMALGDRSTDEVAMALFCLCDNVQQGRYKGVAWRLGVELFQRVAPQHRTTTLYDGTVEVLARCGRWRECFQLLGGMAHVCRPTTESVAAVARCTRYSVDMSNALLSFCKTNQIPLPVRLLYSMFRHLFSKHRTDEALVLFQTLREVSFSAMAQTEFVSLRTLSTAFTDALLYHSDCHEAYRIAIQLKDSLGPVIPLITRQLCTMGSEHTRHIIWGRVAVVDNFVSESKWLPALMEHFDYIFVAYTHVRRTVYAIESRRSTADKSVPILQERLNVLSKNTKEIPRLCTLPFMSQLHAQTFLQPRRIDQAQQMLLTSSRSIVAPLRSAGKGHTTLSIRPEVTETAKALVLSSQRVSTSCPSPTATTGFISVALMLQHWNPEAEVCILTQDDEVLKACTESYAQIVSCVRMRGPTTLRDYFSKNPGKYPFRLGSTPSDAEKRIMQQRPPQNANSLSQADSGLALI